MIIAGLQTGNTRWLAAHLQNAADNETIEVVEVTGTVATDIDGALAEFDAITAGTKATEGVYAAFINPPEPLTRARYDRAIALLEERLGLKGQPRIVLFHVKNGREHCHIVWSRIEIERMRAIHLPHDRQKLRKCAQELAAEFGTKLPPGLAEDRGAERFKAPKQPTRAEKAQAKRSGITPEERRAVITAAWRGSDSGESFVNALEAAGYMLARGDSRAFVVIDVAGDVHSLARQIEGAATKDVRKKLESVNLALLPSVERAKILMLQRAAAQADAARASEKRKAEGKAAAEKLSAVQRKRRAALDLLWQAMKIRHMHEWKVLLAHIVAEKKRHLARRHWQAWGLALYLRKIAFIRQLVEYYESRKKRSQEEHHEALMGSVRRRHENEARELRRRYDALARLERREFATFAQSYGTGENDVLGAGSGVRSTSGKARAHFVPDWQFAENAADMTRPPVANFIAAVRENTLDITAGFAAPHLVIDSLSSSAQGNLTDFGIGAGWMAFQENAAEITESRLSETAPAEKTGSRERFESGSNGPQPRAPPPGL